MSNLLDFRRSVDGFVINIDVDASNDEWSHVGTVESVQTACVDLDCPVSAHQLVSGNKKHINHEILLV